MFKQLKKSLLLKIVTLCLFLTAVFHFGYIVHKWIFSSVQTEFALFVEDAYDSIDVSDAFFIRKESILKDQSNGVISYLVDDGEKIAKNEEIAAFYTDESSIAKRKQLIELEAQIDKLKQLNAVPDATSANPITIDKQIFQDVKNMIMDMNNNDLKKHRRDRENFLYLMSERQIVTRQISNFLEQINELKKKQSEIKISDNEVCKYVKAQEPGYFVKKVDGYESLVDYEAIDEFSLSDFDKVSTSIEHNNTNAVGKVVLQQNWYIAAKVKSEDVVKFRQGIELEILIPSVFSKKISTVVESVNQKSKTQDAIVIFKCDVLNEELISSRRGELKVIFNQYSGIRIPTCALHEKTVNEVVEDENGKHEICKTLKGVYVANAKKLEFREVIPLCIDSKYVICKQNPDPQELFNGETVKVYDRIVTGGRNLYDGKNIW